MAAHPAPPLAVSESEAEALRAMTRAGTTEQRTVMRARIILRAAEGAAHVEIAQELGVSVQTILLWRRRFKEQGLAGLADAPHPGRPRTYGREVREQILAATLTRPATTTHWSRARLAKQVGVSPSTVGRVWAEGRLKPHRVETFKRGERSAQSGAEVVSILVAAVSGHRYHHAHRAGSSLPDRSSVSRRGDADLQPGRNDPADSYRNDRDHRQRRHRRPRPYHAEKVTQCPSISTNRHTRGLGSTLSVLPAEEVDVIATLGYCREQPLQYEPARPEKAMDLPWRRDLVREPSQPILDVASPVHSTFLVVPAEAIEAAVKDEVLGNLRRGLRASEQRLDRLGCPVVEALGTEASAAVSSLGVEGDPQEPVGRDKVRSVGERVPQVTRVVKHSPRAHDVEVAE